MSSISDTDFHFLYYGICMWYELKKSRTKQLAVAATPELFAVVFAVVLAVVFEYARKKRKASISPNMILNISRHPWLGVVLAA